MMRNVLIWIGVLLLPAFATLPCPAQAPAAKPPEWVTRLGELTKEKRFDEAIALVRAKAAEEPPAAEAPQSMFRVAQWLYGVEKYDESLSLLDEIIERFPKSPVASLAWCGKGQVYGRQGKTDEMIAALERGMAAPRAWTETNIMDAGDTHGYACQVLGEHYLKNRQWEKALTVYSAWKPSSWCGTCYASMVADRANRILLCQAHTRRFRTAIEHAWREIARGNVGREGMESFLLVRLYSEAGQLDDLQMLNLVLVEQACEKFPIKQDAENRWRVQGIIQTSGAIADAIAAAKDKSSSNKVEIVRRSEVGNARFHVANWSLIQGARSAVVVIQEEANRGTELTRHFVEFLAAMDNEQSNEALVRLASDGDAHRQQLVCGIIQSRLKDPQPVIAQVVSRLSKDRERYVKSQADPLPISFRFYESWVPPAKGTLPKELPRDLFMEKAAK